MHADKAGQLGQNELKDNTICESNVIIAKLSEILTIVRASGQNIIVKKIN